MRRGHRGAALMVAALVTGSLATIASAEQGHLLIVVGLGGEPKYTEAFHKMALSMVSAAEKKMGLPAANVVYLGEKEEAGVPAAGMKARSTRENVEKALTDMAGRVQPGDVVFILLIGHGSFQSGQSRFNLPGPDMSAEDFSPLLLRFASQKVVFVNTASASGDFVKTLAGRNRTIVTATKSGMERNETVFAQYFVEAFTGDGADADKDQRVSVLEAFEYAHREVARFYEKGQRLLTEHAVLEDNGDGVGSAEPDPKTGDGALARSVFLGGRGEVEVAGGPSTDPRVVQLQKERRAVEEKIEALKARKAAMAAAAYEGELEKLLLELALKEEAIRRAEATK